VIIFIGVTEFRPDDSSIRWSTSEDAELVKGYLLLFASDSIYEAYLFTRCCKNDGFSNLFGAATTVQEASDLIQDAGSRKLICLISDSISSDCGACIASEIRAANPFSKSILIVTDIEKYCTLAPERKVFDSLCSSAAIGRGGIYRALEGMLSRKTFYIDPLLRKALEELEQAGLLKISQREREILQLLAEGLTNKQIASRIFIAERTVRDYVSSILEKIGMGNRAGAAAWAIRHGLAAS
jgi:two-component system response regulator DevR